MGTRSSRRCSPATRLWSRRPRLVRARYCACGGDGVAAARRESECGERAPPRLGAALVAHPGVDMVSFTGGLRTGRAVMAAAAASTKPVVLELGGRSAVLAPDVEIDAALADKIVGATFVTSGPGVHGHQAAVRPRGAGGGDGEALVPVWRPRWWATDWPRA